MKPTGKCPICKKRVSPPDPEFPFCSERCRIIDLGNWASGKYVIATPLPADSKVEEEESEE